MATMDYENENGRYDDDQRYDRDRSASPRPKRDDDYRGGRDRSASPGGRADPRGPPPGNRSEEPDAAPNSGSNLFVTGLPQSLSEEEVSNMFRKYGDVENCSIMKDPHTHESRGFGFVKMATSDQADGAKEGLQGESIQGRTLSIEKARRNRPRTPTPGRYFGPPKREGFRRDERRGPGGSRDGGPRDSYSRGDDDRRGGYGRRNDYYRRDIDRYASDRGGYERRDDRRDRDERRGGGYGDYGREPRNYDRGGGDRDRDRYSDRR